MAKIPYRFYLSEEDLPKQWYNLRADMKEQPDPLINPGTMQPAVESDLYPVFCEKLAHQEMDGETRYFDIPESVQEMYRIYRPSPLIRAYNLEKALDTPAKIYYKFEGNNTSGSHKLNSAIAQVYYAKEQGLTSLTTETGAGQWGTALSEASSYFDIPLTVYMVKVSYEQKPFRKAVMQVFDGKVVPSPSETTDIGLIAPFMQDKLTGKADPRIIAVEPASCPSLTRGRYAYDFCDTGKITPMAKMYTLGSGFIPSANHAGGLRYHGMSPILSKLYHDGYMEATSVEQTRVFEAAVYFAKKETILPAPESAHAIRAAMDEALRCKETGEAKTILFGLTGTGYFDMTAYSAYLEGRMNDYIPSDEDLQKGFDSLPKIPGIQE